MSTQKKPPLPKKEQLLALEKVAPDLAAGYLNNEFTNSYTNAWQYQVVAKAPHTYFNKKFEEKEELRESHILWELDREKTYYRSALERINPQQIRNQMEAEKLRRTNMQMSLNQNVMEKTYESASKFSNSLKKLPSVTSKPKSPFKEGAFHQINTIHERTGSGFYNSSAASTMNGAAGAGGVSPLKLMSMTMPKGFVSPKNGRKAP